MIAGKDTIFPILTLDEGDKLDRLIELANPNLDSRGLKRLAMALNGHCASVVVERHYIDKDFRDTFSHFHSKRFSTPLSRCIRLHFFSKPVTEDMIVEASAEAREAYLGYSVVRPTKPNCIGRTLLSYRLRGDGDSHLCVCREKVMILGTEYQVAGFPFISQDADATVCAESTLWMLLRYFSNRYPMYAEILPFQITSLAANHARGTRVYPSSGLYSWQLAEALRLQDFSPVVYSRNQFETKFDHLLYTYIESGIPVLITLPQHVVAGYGHTSDFSTSATTLTGSNWAYTSSYNQSFLINDDNFYPYQTLRAQGQQTPSDSKFAWKDINEFIVPLPERVFLTAEQAQVAIEKILAHPQLGLSALAPDLMTEPVVLRLFLTSTRAFKKRLRERKMGHPLVEKIYRHLPMPHFVWVCEIARESEYRTSHKVCGEIIWDATRNAHEPDGWIALHISDVLMIDKGSAMNSLQDIQRLNLENSTSYELFRSNLRSI